MTSLKPWREGSVLYICACVNIREWNQVIGIGRKEGRKEEVTLQKLSWLSGFREIEKNFWLLSFNTDLPTSGVWKAKGISHLLFLLEEVECDRIWSLKNEVLLLIRHSCYSQSQMQFAKLSACRNTRKSALKPQKYLQHIGSTQH